MTIEIINGDITELSVDAIVNPNNKWLLAGSGLCGSIYRKAGKEILEATSRKICQDNFGGYVPCGSAVVTDSYGLNCKIIIHVVPPKHLIDPLNSLEECYRNALMVADAQNCASIAFPAIGIGINKIPLDQTFSFITNALKDFESNTLNHVIFCLKDIDVASMYRERLIL
jgi:O-acetyl-ADP-ribose deacetylase (regulator of RNase III)